MLSLGKGAAYGTSTRQKLNTKSSTKAELVGVKDLDAAGAVDPVLEAPREWILKVGLMESRKMK
jgi:hypothetical protein